MITIRKLRESPRAAGSQTPIEATMARRAEHILHIPRDASGNVPLLKDGRLDTRGLARVVSTAKSIGGKRVEYRIEGFPGLALFCEPSGAANWYALFSVQNGKRLVTKRMRLAEREALSVEGAGAMAAEIVAKARKGSDPALDKQLARNAITLGELVQLRLDEKELAGELKASTVEQQRALVKLFFDNVPGIKGRQADKISAAEMRSALQAFVASGAKRSEGREAGHPYSNKTRDLVKMSLSAAYKWGQDTGRCENNPIRDIRNSSKSEPRENRATEADLKTLWAACDDTAAPLTDDMRDIIKLAVLTGQRRGEVVFIERGHLNEDLSVWTIPGDRQECRKGRTVTVHGITKNGKEQVVPLSAEASAILSRAIERAGGRLRLFNVLPNAVTVAMGRLREQYGIGDVTVHSLRRTIAKWAGEQRDIRAEAIEALLNHSPRSDDVTRRHYNQVRLTDEVRDILERWGEYVAGVVAGKVTKKSNVVLMSSA
jgi:integrase